MSLDPTHEHLHRAYAQLKRPDWPALAVLREAYLHYSLVRARAAQMAQGQTLPPVPLPVPISGPRAPRDSTQAMRRRTDLAAFDPRSAAAGEYLHTRSPDEA